MLDLLNTNIVNNIKSRLNVSVSMRFRPKTTHWEFGVTTKVIKQLSPGEEAKLLTKTQNQPYHFAVEFKPCHQPETQDTQTRKEN